MRLNINSVSDTTEDYPGWKRTDMGGWDYYPAISSDGKTLIYTSRRTWNADRYESLWISRLLIDEKGNVITKVKEPTKENIPNFQLSQNYPNPFNPTTKISYSLNTSGFVTLKIYDLLGREITTLVNEHKKPGSYEGTFNANSTNKILPSGVYFYKLQVNDFTECRKMVFVK